MHGSGGLAPGRGIGGFRGPLESMVLLLHLLLACATGPGPADPDTPAAQGARRAGELADEAARIRALVREVEALVDPETHPEGLSEEEVRVLQEKVEALHRQTEALDPRFMALEEAARTREPR